MKKTIIALTLTALWISSKLAFGFEPSLEIRIESRSKEVNDISQFVLSVEFHNLSNEEYVVFPAYLRRNFKAVDGQEVRFQPYPGPAVNPWPTAILLKASERKAITLKGVNSAEGMWELEYGHYDLSVSLQVMPTSTFGAGDVLELFRNKPIWRGTVKSNSMTIWYHDET